MSRGQAALLVGAVFVAGIATGALGMLLVVHERPFWPHRGELEDGFAERMRRHLDLSPEQSERIGQIMRETFAESRALRERLGPQVRAVMERSQKRIEQVLTPEQRAEFAKLRREQRRRADYFFLGRGPHPPWLRERHHPPPEHD
ncbi:MAG TPA: hypothetical protein VGB99_09130 [Acidobacteriota bacterium]